MFSSSQFSFAQPFLGCDVEFFFQNKQSGKVVGAEKVIKKNGIKCSDNNGKIIIDGVQAELNPEASFCREILGANIGSCLYELRQSVLSSKEKIGISTDQTIEVDKEEFDSLSEDSKRFGCDPDYNAHKGGKANIVKVDPKEYKYRSAGGHIHVGCHGSSLSFLEGTYRRNDNYNLTINLNNALIFNKMMNVHETTQKEIEIDTTNKELMIYIIDMYRKHGYSFDKIHKVKININQDYCGIQYVRHPELLIPLLDIFVGIPSVLLDRDKNAALRRKVYGRAGDYRLPPWGVEYRTLSNWWLRNYTLMHFVTGMARMACLVVMNDLRYKTSNATKLIEMVSTKDIQSAINKNDFEKAKKIFKVYEPYMVEIGNITRSNHPISDRTIREFKQVVVDGIDKHFPEKDFVYNWTETNRRGWEYHCQEYVHPQTNIDTVFDEIVKE